MTVDELAEKVERNHRELTERVARNHREQSAHINAHKQRARILAGVALGVGSLVAWSASQFREATTAGAAKQCGEAARLAVVDARAEHGELRAADQRLVDKQHELDRQLQVLAMWRLGQQDKVKPR